jgi:quercetin dioxygenase-like cupin family protein
MKRLILGAVLGAALTAAAMPALGLQTQTTTRVPQFENEHVKVWRTVILPNQPLSMHRHEHPRSVVAIKGGMLTIVQDSGERESVTWETGNAYWLEADEPGTLHGDVNEGDEEMVVVVVEMK